MKKSIAGCVMLLLAAVFALGIFAGCGEESYKVTFKPNGGGEESERVVKKGESVAAPLLTWEGYEFSGWYLSEDFSGEKVNFPYLVESDVVFYAKWQKKAREITVTFETNGASALSPVKLIEGQAIESSPVCVYSGFTFGGWYLSAGFAEPSVGFPFTPENDCTLYAKWIPNEPDVYTVAFATNGGLPTLPPAKIAEGAAVQTAPAVEKENYRFLGWYDNAAFTGDAVTFPYYPAANVTLYAKWEKLPEEYIITFVTNGGHEVPQLTVIEGNEIAECPFTRRDGHAFTGWYDNELLTGNAIEFPFTPQKSMTLYAKWEERVTEDTAFVFNGGVLQGFSEEGKNLKEIIIPSAAGEAAVTEIAAGAFKNCASLENVSIPAGVEKIGLGAFEGCTALKSVTLPFVGENADGSGNAHFGHIFGAEDFYSNRQKVPASLKEVVISSGSRIVSSAFEDCNSIESINLPYGITNIDSSAFSFCSSLKTINIPISVHSLGNSAFFGCASLEKIVLPEGLEEIGSATFQECKKLSSVTIPSGVKFLGSYAFSTCISLTQFIMPDSVESVGEYLFSGCEKLQTVSFSVNLAAIEERMFENCSALVTVSIPDSVKKIGRAAFANCSLLSVVKFSEFSTLTDIEPLAFDSCVSLSVFTVPASVKAIGEAAFYGCTNIRRIVFLSASAPTLKEGSIIDKEQTVAVDALSGLAPSAAFYVPKGKAQEYAASLVFSKYAAQIRESE